MIITMIAAAICNLMFALGPTGATMDLNLSQLEYIANHLRPEECRRLMAALQDPGLDLVLNLDTTERKIPEDVTCLSLLVHWNSAAGEGRGNTHQLLTRRLKQLKMDDLSAWLSRSVFRQLSADIDKGFLQDPLKELAKTNESLEQVLLSMTREPMATPEEPDQWLPIDTLMCVSIIVLLFIMAALVGKVTFDHFCQRRVKTGHKQTLRRSSRRNQPKKHIGFRNQNYEKVPVTDPDDNDDDIALKAMGIRQTQS